MCAKATSQPVSHATDHTPQVTGRATRDNNTRNTYIRAAGRATTDGVADTHDDDDVDMAATSRQPTHSSRRERVRGTDHILCDGLPVCEVGQTSCNQRRGGWMGGGGKGEMFLALHKRAGLVRCNVRVSRYWGGAGVEELD